MDGAYPAWLANPNAMARQTVAGLCDRGQLTKIASIQYFAPLHSNGLLEPEALADLPIFPMLYDFAGSSVDRLAPQAHSRDLLYKFVNPSGTRDRLPPIRLITNDPQ
jgi:hypothetical protein